MCRRSLPRREPRHRQPLKIQVADLLSGVTSHTMKAGSSMTSSKTCLTMTRKVDIFAASSSGARSWPRRPGLFSPGRWWSPTRRTSSSWHLVRSMERSSRASFLTYPNVRSVARLAIMDMDMQMFFMSHSVLSSLTTSGKVNVVPLNCICRSRAIAALASS
ncbi:gp84.1 [Caviid betaherpesvirus 2]|uniref:Gp84.1 n=1 Tax=Guinea pig cytomegalovirus (strain 22122) TaxID=103920 RepID=B7TPY9_GPCMV|nr:gp84.1 [Caviid betaherpesvirus 2]AGE11555.1 gp84.1 [Caviid betaherpesvirus 2]AIL83943.1 gp84.1 [BAC cloning vector GPN13BACdenovo_preserved(MM)]BAJ78543.1 gp84.1 [Caviid betaherpesvirus 2]